MKHTTYRYNSATCRYEPVPWGVKNILRPALIFLAVSTASFFGLLYLHSSWLTTEKELALKDENQALNYHLGKLSDEITTVNTLLASLKDSDRNVQKKLATDNNTLPEVDRPTSHLDVNLKTLLKNTQAKTSSLYQKAQLSNQYFGTSIEVSPEDLSLLTNIPSIQPIDSKDLTKLASGYGMQANPYHKGNYFHRGIDFVAPRGSFVYATAGGIISNVKTSDFPMGEGNTVEIDHGNGYRTRYAHLGGIQVKPGQKVEKGAVIATIGISGSSVAPHLHYEVLKNNKKVDPIEYLLENLSTTDYSLLVLQAKQKNQSLD